MPAGIMAMARCKCLFKAVILFAAGGVAAAAVAAVNHSGDTVYYTGPISQQQNRSLFVAAAGRQLRRLVITSSGGEVDAGIQLGEWVFQQRLDVEVTGYCLSSCANYVFTAGSRKTIHPGAVVAWHGNYHHLQYTGQWKDEVAGRMERNGEDVGTAQLRVLEQVERLAGLERAFFERIGVNEYLCWVGKMPPHNVPDYYFLSAQDMARFGVGRVNTPPGYEHTDVSPLGRHVIHIQLSDHVTDPE